ncbi:MAG: FHA domain-containing protein [Planctomycetes bacterium]|nr:FHA domain-containing protein [Planctomycetota bacterium]NOG53674.1 FHA domain-containing protein [Planctomycetota bacterium]
MLILKVIQGPDRGKRFELPAWEPQLIGRSSEALRISDQTCSRRHAELTPDKGQWYLRDLGSANGTYVNGSRLSSEPVRLRLGDQIRAGSTVFVFGTRRYGPHNNPIRTLQPEFIDAIVEQRVAANDESVIMAVPDPAAAAVEHLRIIYDLTRITTQALDRDGLFETVMDLVFQEFEPERGFILIVDEQENVLEPVVVRYRIAPRTAEEGQIHVSRTIVNHVIESGEGVLSSNAMKDRRFAAGDSVQNYGIRSAICVPIKYHQHIYGVIHIDTSLANYTFSESQLHLLTAIGQHAGLAYSNLDLYKQHLDSTRLAAIGETVASLSHSIKNILQGLRGGADVMGMALKKNDLKLARHGWDILSRNLDRIYALTLNMLTFSKQRRVELEHTQIDRLLDEVVELILPQCDRRGVALITDYDQNTPPIPLDPNMMHQALMNLLTNALEAVEPNKGIITFRCHFMPDEKSVSLLVIDNGPGISDTDIDSIWLPFHSTKGIRGTGLGLSVARKIIEEHGGQISVESDEGEGTTFTVRLLADAAAVSDPSETLSPTLPGTTPAAYSRDMKKPPPKLPRRATGHSDYDLV